MSDSYTVTRAGVPLAYGLTLAEALAFKDKLTRDVEIVRERHARCPHCHQELRQ